MKKVSRAQGNKRLLQLAEFLEKLPRDKFDFSTWGRESSCGTVACALGWAPSMPFAKNMGIRLKAEFLGHEVMSFFMNGRFVTEFTVSKELFGLYDGATLFLFTPTDKDDLLGNNGLSMSSTAKKVAANIRRFVAIRSS